MSEENHTPNSNVLPSRGKRAIAIVLTLIVVIAVIIAVWLYNRHLDLNIQSEDAAFEADVIHVAALVPGKLIELPIEDAQKVKKGDLLMRIDPSTYELRVQQAQAQLALAQATLNNQMRLIRAEAANAEIADEQIRRARINLELTDKTLARLEALLPKGYVTAQEVDIARTAQRDAQVSLTQALAQQRAAEALVGETEAAQAAVDIAIAGLAIAKKALSDTIITAPFDGLIVGLNVSEGELLLPEQSLFTLIDTKTWYATAVMRETNLPHIQIGNCVTVYALAAPKTPMKGVVQSIGWGVTSSDIIDLPRLMPVVQKSLNWVRVAQRFPVRIRMIDPIDDLMRIGASASVTIRDTTDCER